MTLLILRDDALRSDGDGTSIRLSLPWIRSLPLASLRDLVVEIDGARIDDIVLRLGDREIATGELSAEHGWWYLQDRLVLVSRRRLAPGPHRVDASFRLSIPYLPGGPDAALTLPFRHERDCVLDAPAPRDDVSRDAA